MSKIDPDFARKLSHDLKAPLSALNILRDLIENPEQKDLMDGAIQRFEEIIDLIQAEKSKK
ncbi:MAG: hypothetical protein AB8E15_01505 [Bdellovibrionales bacterium]